MALYLTACVPIPRFHEIENGVIALQIVSAYILMTPAYSLDSDIGRNHPPVQADLSITLLDLEMVTSRHQSVPWEAL